jgi:hypothetical protein
VSEGAHGGLSLLDFNTELAEIAEKGLERDYWSMVLAFRAHAVLATGDALLSAV